MIKINKPATAAESKTQMDSGTETARYYPEMQNNFLESKFPENDVLFANDVEPASLPNSIQSLQWQYCANSGRPIRKLENPIVESMIAIHGEANAIKLLEINRKGYSPEWLWLNETGLQQLAIHRPAEYFIYTCTKLLAPLANHDEQAEFEQKIIAWQNMDNLQIADDVIQPINELIRRILGNWHGHYLKRFLLAFANRTLETITSSLDNLIILQIELTDLIPELIKLQKQREETERGLRVFKAQKMIRHLSQLEIEVNMELNDFDFIDGKSSENLHGIIGTRYQHAHKKHDLRTQNQLLTAEPEGGFSRKPIIKKGTGIRLKIGGNK